MHSDFREKLEKRIPGRHPADDTAFCRCHRLPAALEGFLESLFGVKIMTENHDSAHRHRRNRLVRWPPESHRTREETSAGQASGNGDDTGWIGLHFMHCFEK